MAIDLKELQFKYNRITSRLEKFSSFLEIEDNKNSNLSESNPQVKLPNIQLPSFSGSFTEWITFRDTFLSLIHNNNSLTKIEKFHYLKSSVKSTASQTIEHLTPSDSNYESAWSLLTSRYENKRLITQHHVRALFSLPNASKDAKT
jgi:hypothetical protein